MRHSSIASCTSTLFKIKDAVRLSGKSQRRVCVRREACGHAVSAMPRACARALGCREPGLGRPARTCADRACRQASRVARRARRSPPPRRGSMGAQGGRPLPPRPACSHTLSAGTRERALGGGREGKGAQDGAHVRGRSAPHPPQPSVLARTLPQPCAWLAGPRAGPPLPRTCTRPASWSDHCCAALASRSPCISVVCVSTILASASRSSPEEPPRAAATSVPMCLPTSASAANIWWRLWTRAHGGGGAVGAAGRGRGLARRAWRAGPRCSSALRAEAGGCGSVPSPSTCP